MTLCNVTHICYPFIWLKNLSLFLRSSNDIIWLAQHHIPLWARLFLLFTSRRVSLTLAKLKFLVQSNTSKHKILLLFLLLYISYQCEISIMNDDGGRNWESKFVNLSSQVGVAILDPTRQPDTNSTRKIRIRVGGFRVRVEFGLTQNQPRKIGSFSGWIRVTRNWPEITRKLIYNINIIYIYIIYIIFIKFIS